MICAGFGWTVTRESTVHATPFHLSIDEENVAIGVTRRETQVAEAPDKDTQGDTQPEPVKLASRGVTATVASLAAAVVIAAAVANFLPTFDVSWPKFDRSSFPKLDHLSFS